MGKSSGNALQRAHYSSQCYTHSANRWTVRSFVSCNFANDSREETIVHTDFQFGTVEEAMQAGVEFAIKWIEGKQDLLKER